MNNFRYIVLSISFCLLVACDNKTSSSDDTNNISTDAAKSLPASATNIIDNSQAQFGQVVKTVPMKRMPTELAAIATGQVIAYRMPAIRGGQTVATGMLFVPKGKPPVGGWPLLVFGHDTEGASRDDAPSVYIQADPPNKIPPTDPRSWTTRTDLISFGTPQGYWRCDHLLAELIKSLGSGLVVMAVDYEGMGPAELGVPDTGHPYVVLPSLGRSMVYGGVAAKRQLGDKLSGAWAGAGFSQGSISAMAAAEYSSLATEAESDMEYRGTLALGPPVLFQKFRKDQWAAVEQLTAAGNKGAAMGALNQFNYHAFVLMKGFLAAGIKIDPKEWLGERGYKIYQADPDMPHTHWTARMREDIASYGYESIFNTAVDYPGHKLSEQQMELYAENEPAQKRLPGKTLFVVGDEDKATPGYLAVLKNTEMLARGDDISISLIPNLDHFGLLNHPDALAVSKAHLQNLFSKTVSAQGYDPVEADAIQTVVFDYFDGINTKNRKRIERAFSKTAQLKSPAEDGTVKFEPIADAIERWMEGKAKERIGKVLSIKVTEGQVAEVKFDFDGEFIDFLTLMKLNGQWKIVDKVFISL